MHKAIEVLMGEHRLIEEVLGSLEACARETAAGTPLLRATVAEYAEFFHQFTDACHHGKEEDVLFRRMIERGFPRESGPLAMMFCEHEMGRNHVQGFAEIAAGEGGLSSQEIGRFLDHARTYVPLLGQHVLKEDRVLYPMAMELLSDSELDRMSEDFERIEKRLHGDGSCDRLRALADRLITRFRPMEAPVSCACHSAR